MRHQDRRIAILKEICPQTERHYKEYLGSIKSGVVEEVNGKLWSIRIEVDVCQCPFCERVSIYGMLKSKLPCIRGNIRMEEEK